MPVDASVQVLHSGMAGHPVLSGTAGAGVGMLDAVLVDGWGLAGVDSITIASGVASVAKAGHPCEPGTVVVIAGASVTGGVINGRRKVLTTSAAGYTVDAAGIPDQVATGTITHKVAPLGWDRVYTAGNVRVYRSPNVAGTRAYLRVDDSAAQVMRLVAYESMSDIDTGVGPTPTAAQVSGGLWWSKSGTANTTERHWRVYGDDRAFVLRLANNNNVRLFFVGDFKSRKSPDAYRFVVMGGAADYTSTTSSNNECLGTSSYTFSDAMFAGTYLLRAVSGVGAAVKAMRTPLLPRSAPLSTFSSGAASSGQIRYPNGAANEMLVTAIGLHESTDDWRGDLPGVWWSPQAIGTAVFANGDNVPAADDLAGRTLHALLGSNATPLFVDVTGPWF